MDSETNKSTKKQAVKRAMDVVPDMPLIKGAWTTEEDRKLSEVIAVHGAKKWKIIANKAGLNRCGKSCRLRWLNYLRPNIKRGNISDQEEDLILRLHKLLGNRWSLIAGRLPGRTDNEIKNYWNSHLSKKIKQKENQSGSSGKEESRSQTEMAAAKEKDISTEPSEENSTEGSENQKFDFFADDLFMEEEEEGPLNLKWVSEFLEVD